MQISKKKVNPNFKKQVRRLFYQVIADIRHPQEAKDFLESFLAPSEMDIASRRLGIAYFLSQNRTYSYIKTSLSVSSATVSAMAKQLEAKADGVVLALKKIKADEWADEWAGRLSRMVGKKSL